MINLYEYQSKNLFTHYNLPVLKGQIYSEINGIQSHIKNNVGPWIAKCQIHSGGRGNSGGIFISNTAEKILSFSKKWLGNKIITHQTTNTGEFVNYILIEPAIKFSQELYVSISIDRESENIICVASSQGGVNIENVSKINPDVIHKIIIHPVTGAHPYQGRILACKLGLSGKKIHQFSKIVVNMSHMFLEKDLILVEINPLVISDNDNFCCLDAKIIIDRNSMFRQSKLLEILSLNKQAKKNPKESKIATLEDVNYIPLFKGNIGCMVNGAGLAMATMDLIKEAGGTPANFLDIGGEASKECMISSLHMLLNNKMIQAILINIFGGIVCCALVANSIVAALSTNKTNQNIPIIVRLQGNNDKLGLKILTDSMFNITITDNLINAIQQVVSAVK